MLGTRAQQAGAKPDRTARMAEIYLFGNKATDEEMASRTSAGHGIHPKPNPNPNPNPNPDPDPHQVTWLCKWKDSINGEDKCVWPRPDPSPKPDPDPRLSLTLALSLLPTLGACG